MPEVCDQSLGVIIAEGNQFKEVSGMGIFSHCMHKQGCLSAKDRKIGLEIVSEFHVGTGGKLWRAGNRILQAI